MTIAESKQAFADLMSYIEGQRDRVHYADPDLSFFVAFKRPDGSGLCWMSGPKLFFAGVLDDGTYEVVQVGVGPIEDAKAIIKDVLHRRQKGSTTLQLGGGKSDTIAWDRFWKLFTTRVLASMETIP